jgi:hypothetical protein
MKFVTFRTPKAKRFNYNPRFYDPEKEELEQKKAAMGLESTVSHRENLRLQMSRRWHKNKKDVGRSRNSLLISYSIYAIIILGGIYLIFFSNFIETLLTAFGVIK